MKKEYLKETALIILAGLGFGLVFYVIFAIRTAERTSKQDHIWRLSHGRGINE